MRSLFSFPGKMIPQWAALMLFCAALYSCTEKETEYLTFSVSNNVSYACQDGMAEIEIKASHGKMPLSFYVIPEEQWDAGDRMQNMLYNNDFSRLYRYTHNRNIIEVEGGPSGQPKSYWVAVQDINGDAPVSGTNMLAWWKKVSVACSDPGAE